jgi:hypothetical protein
MAITGTKKLITYIGDKLFVVYELTGDAGGGTTYTLPMNEIDGAWFNKTTSTSADEKMSYSGAVLTFGTALGSGEKAYVNAIGS